MRRGGRIPPLLVRPATLRKEVEAKLGQLDALVGVLPEPVHELIPEERKSDIARTWISRIIDAQRGQLLGDVRPLGFARVPDENDALGRAELAEGASAIDVDDLGTTGLHRDRRIVLRASEGPRKDLVGRLILSRLVTSLDSSGVASDQMCIARELKGRPVISR